MRKDLVIVTLPSQKTVKLALNSVMCFYYKGAEILSFLFFMMQIFNKTQRKKITSSIHT